MAMSGAAAGGPKSKGKKRKTKAAIARKGEPIFTPRQMGDIDAVIRAWIQSDFQATERDVIQTVRRAIEAGAFDAALRQRYGLNPRGTDDSHRFRAAFTPPRFRAGAGASKRSARSRRP
jgi:hypothetical protein